MRSTGCCEQSEPRLGSTAEKETTLTEMTELGSPKGSSTKIRAGPINDFAVS